PGTGSTREIQGLDGTEFCRAAKRRHHCHGGRGRMRQGRNRIAGFVGVRCRLSGVSAGGNLCPWTSRQEVTYWRNTRCLDASQLSMPKDFAPELRKAVRGHSQQVGEEPPVGRVAR